MTDSEFIKAWNMYDTPQQVADATGLTYTSVTSRASLLRRFGYDLPKKFKDKDFYKRIGSLGGKKGTTGGFYANRELARIAGARGGRVSRRIKND